jgi:hypothetical protein
MSLPNLNLVARLIAFLYAYLATPNPERLRRRAEALCTFVETSDCSSIVDALSYARNELRIDREDIDNAM